MKSSLAIAFVLTCLAACQLDAPRETAIARKDIDPCEAECPPIEPWDGAPPPAVQSLDSALMVYASAPTNTVEAYIVDGGKVIWASYFDYAAIAKLLDVVRYTGKPFGKIEILEVKPEPLANTRGPRLPGETTKRPCATVIIDSEIPSDEPACDEDPTK